MPSTHNHDCHPIWISQLGPVATCNAHWWKPVGPTPNPTQAPRS